jgi:hypothetical protein
MRTRLAIALLATIALPASAEALLTMKVRHGETADDSVYTIWFAGDKLREDRASRSIVINGEVGKMFVIKHDARTYQVLDLPIDFKTMLPPDLQAEWESALAARKPEVAVESAEDTSTLGGRTVREHRVRVTGPMGGSMNLVLWNEADPGFDVPAYKQLMLEMAALQPGSDDWIRPLFALDGFPVRMEQRVGPEGQQQLAMVEELVSVEQKPAPEGHWGPPPTYTEIEFNLLQEPPGQ